MSGLIPPSAVLLPSVPDLRERLTVALREVDLLRRLIRATNSVRPHPITTGGRVPTLGSQKGDICG